MPGVFVTATGTEVGKTYVTAGLIRACRRAGTPVDALKPISSGYSDEAAATSDGGLLVEALGLDITADTIARIAPWRFAAPLSPDMAAALEGRSIDVDAVLAACRAIVRADRLTLIEGVGGTMVPLDGRRTTLDLATALGLPAILVSATGLGAISHCLTSHAVLVARSLSVPIVVLNETPGSSVPLDGTRRAIETFCAGSVVEPLGRDADDIAFDRLLTTLTSTIRWTPPPSRDGRSTA